MVRSINVRGRISDVEKAGPVVVEACERCGRRREIAFRKESG